MTEATPTGAAPDQDEIIENLRITATEGDPRACYGLGMLYAHGQGVELNYSEAASWLERAAEHSIAEAQRVFAWLHATVRGEAERRAGASVVHPRRRGR